MTVQATPENKKRWKRRAAERAKFIAFQQHYESIVSQRDGLLAALEAIELWSRDHPNGTCEAINEKARAVIAKATP